MPHLFKPLYHADRIEIVNPGGDVGLITLWSPLTAVKRKLAAIAPEALQPASSRIAAIGNLYGDGMYAMFCNLLFNPQVKHLIAIGEDLDLPTCDEIESFISHGLEDVTLLGAHMKRIKGTDRFLPRAEGFEESTLRHRLTFSYLGKLSSDGLQDALTTRLRELPSEPPKAVPPRIAVEDATGLGATGLDGADLDATGLDATDLDAANLDESHVSRHAASTASSRTRRPSQIASHDVERPTPIRCWEELVVRTMRFGREVELRNGRRIELLNARALITKPEREPAEALKARGFDLGDLIDYGEKLLDPSLPPHISYTYGNRLRSHFTRNGAPLDTLAAAIDTLTRNPESRHAYISLWDNDLDTAATPPDTPYTTSPDAPTPPPDAPYTDITTPPDTPYTDIASPASPCLVTLFFRKNEGGTLHLTATYRSHNLLTAWLRNVYGLMAIQEHVAAACGMPSGPLTVISHSLGIDPSSPRYALAQSLAERWRSDDEVDVLSRKRSLRQDPNGYFVVSVDVDRREIVVEHRFEGILLKRYAGRRASGLVSAIAADMAVSLPSHALWLGAEIARNEALLSAGADEGEGEGEDA